MSSFSPSRSAGRRAAPLRAFGVPRPQMSFEGRIDTRRRRRLKNIARELPMTPGVYFFYGLDDRLLYIGKANRLRERVRSYFGETKKPRSRKLRRLLAEIERLEFTECGSELEALLLERRLIAARRPLLNRQLKRFDVYPYLLLSDEEFPRFTVTRAEPVREKPEQDEEELPEEPATEPQCESAPLAGEVPGLYLGPFTTPRAAYQAMEAVRNSFPLRSCEGELYPEDPHSRSCFYHDIGRCAGPCIGAVSREKYFRICRDLLQLLETGKAPQLDLLRSRMEKFAGEWKFEEAAKLREQLQAIENVVLRLRRLERMRRENNLAIIQPAKYFAGEAPRANLFLVRGGVVREQFVLADWSSQRKTARDLLFSTFSSPEPSRPFTAKEELDEMMIIDRWLKAHGTEPCCIWLGQEQRAKTPAWAGHATRKLHTWAKHHLGME